MVSFAGSEMSLTVRELGELAVFSSRVRRAGSFAVRESGELAPLQSRVRRAGSFAVRE